MINIKGKYTSAKIFTDNVETNALSMIQTFCDQEFMKDSKVRIMPDVHAGKGCTIGTTMTIKDKIIPDVVGVDISCGMLVVKLKDRKVDLNKLDRCISQNIPNGSDVRRKPHRWCDQINLLDLRCYDHIKRVEKQILAIGSLGSGNHFIELNKDEDDNLYLVIHSGSRNLGLQVANYYQQAAYDSLHGKDAYHESRKKIQIKEMINRLTQEGRQKEISSAIKNFKYDPEICESKMKIPYELSYCEGQLFDDYIYDMKIMQNFAHLNRIAIADTIQCGMRWDVDDMFETVHNYIDTDNMILRKGAISAQKDEIAIIPMNMRDGSLIVKGKGNQDWNYSAPHGAGRIMSRSEAKNSIAMKEFKESMKDIYSTSVVSSTIDEAPQAYKPMQEIIDNISDTVEIVNIIKPVYNFKAH